MRGGAPGPPARRAQQGSLFVRETSTDLPGVWVRGHALLIYGTKRNHVEQLRKGANVKSQGKAGKWRAGRMLPPWRSRNGLLLPRLSRVFLTAFLSNRAHKGLRRPPPRYLHNGLYWVTRHTPHHGRSSPG